jgi:AraC-like DNA-binding protein
MRVPRPPADSVTVCADDRDPGIPKTSLVFQDGVRLPPTQPLMTDMDLLTWSLRPEWCHEVSALCQRAVERLSVLDRVGFRATFDELAAHLPTPASTPERAFLTYRLHTFATSAGLRFHRGFHARVGSGPCDGSPLEDSYGVWVQSGPTDDPRDLLREWTRRYVLAFERAHKWPAPWCAAELLRTRPARALDVTLLARSAGCGRSLLTRSFRQEFGMSIGAFQRLLRVRLAIRLLRSSSMPVRRIASEVGYDNPANLYNVIRQFTSMTPATIRVAERPLVDALLDGRLTVPSPRVSAHRGN